MTRDLPLVSIITPCLNPGRRLSSCISSVRNQTYPRIEHVVMDGGSSDGTVQLLAETEGLIWKSERDDGQASAINKGIGVASGEIVGWLNADDQLMPDAVEWVVEFLTTTRAGWAFGDLEIVEGEAVDLWEPHSDPKRHMLDLGKGGVVPQPGSLFTAQAIQKVGGLDESFRLAMDFDLWLRLIDAGIPWVYVPKTLARFEVHASSKTGAEGLGAFYVEEARALAKSGRPRLGAVALGRAAAHASLSENRVDATDLRSEVKKLTGSFDRRIVVAAARTEAALIEAASGHGILAARHLLRLGPWAVRETRRRLIHAGFSRLRA